MRRLSKAIATDSKAVHLIPSDIALERQRRNTKFYELLQVQQEQELRNSDNLMA